MLLTVTQFLPNSKPSKHLTRAMQAEVGRELPFVVEGKEIGLGRITAAEAVEVEGGMKVELTLDLGEHLPASMKWAWETDDHHRVGVEIRNTTPRQAPYESTAPSRSVSR